MAATDDITERLQAATIGSHPLLCRLNEIGNIRSFEGGRTIIEELEFPVLVGTNAVFLLFYGTAAMNL